MMIEVSSSNTGIGTSSSVSVVEHGTIGWFVIIHNTLIRPPKSPVQASHGGDHRHGNHHVDPNTADGDCDHRERGESDGEGAVVERDEVEEGEGIGVVAGEEEEVPASGDEEEEEDGEGVVDEAEEECEEEDEGVVEEEAREVDGDARGGFGEWGREGEGGEGEELTPGTARGHDGLCCFLQAGERFCRRRHFFLLPVWVWDWALSSLDVDAEQRNQYEVSFLSYELSWLTSFSPHLTSPPWWLYYYINKWELGL